MQANNQTQQLLAANQLKLLENQENLQNIQPVTHQRDSERRVEGLSMPKYHGNLNESIGLYIHRVKTFFKAKNLVYENNSEVETRCLAMVVASLHGQAAAWYQERASRQEGAGLKTLKEFEAALRAEFEPDDLQERLRDQLFALQQKKCKDITQYIEQFRRVCTDIQDMSELDKVTFFTRGLKLKTREEVKYRQCKTLTAATKVALEYERAHAMSLGLRSNKSITYSRRRHEDERRATAQRDEVEESQDMEVDNVSVREKHKRDLSKVRCYNCQGFGHIAAKCPKKKKRISTKAPRRQQNNVEVHEEGLSDEEVEYITFGHIEDDEYEDEVQVLRKVEPNDTPAGTQGGWTPVRQLVGVVDAPNEGLEAMMAITQPSKLRHREALMIKPGVMNGKPVKVLIDSGATNSLCRFGLGKHVVRTKTVRLAGYDGAMSEPTRTREVKENIAIDVFFFKDTPMIEWDLKEKDFDVILGQPWFQQHNPVIDWRKQTIVSVDETVEANAVAIDNPGWIAKICHVERQDEVKPANIESVLAEFKDVFPKELPDGLPPKRSVQFDLTLKSDAKPKPHAPFRLAKVEQASLDKFVDNLKKKGWVELSSSDWVSNIFAVPKKDENGKMPSRHVWLKTATANTPMRWVLDYRHVNSQSEIPKIPLPNIEDLFNKMHGCSIFTKIDLASGYHQMLVVPHARKYTAFRTHKEILQWCVAPMGMAGMPGIWSRLMRSLFDKFPFVVVYLDDICIYSTSMSEHAKHLRTVLKVLRKEKLYARMEKCAFAVDKVDFLGHTISGDGLQVDATKVRAIEKWSAPTNRKELLSFLGMAGYYRKFIANYANLVLPISDLAKDSTPWKWTNHQDKAFLTIKAALQQAPVLKLPDFDQPFMITTDASGYCCGAVLSQLDDHGHDRPIAFLSKKLGDTERNWPSHEKELYAIKLALTKWRPYVYGAHFDVFTDNSTCHWFLKTPVLTAKLTRWLDFFSSFDFTLHHRPGKMNVVADALSRPPQASVQFATCAVHECDSTCTERYRTVRSWSDKVGAIKRLDAHMLSLMTDATSPGEDVQLNNVEVEVPQRLVINHTEQMSYSTVKMSDGLKQRFVQAYAKTKEFEDETKYVKKEELYFVRSKDHVWKLCVPDDDFLKGEIISQSHDSSTAAHPGVRRTQLHVSQWYFWVKLNEDVKLYVATCETCARYKTSSTKANGRMIPIQSPSECWHTVSVDWITGLPVSNGMDAIMTCVDKTSKRPKYCATTSNVDAPTAAKEFFDTVVRHHGLPAVIISDRDSKFTSQFWQELMKVMGVKHFMTTAGRAQSDGATERQNRTLEDALRCQVSYLGHDWTEHLPTIEYAHQGLVQTSTGLTPFEVDTGRKLRNPTVNGIEAFNEYAKNFAEHRRECVEMALANLDKAQSRQKEYYDKKRSDVEFCQGDMVMLATRDIPLKHAQLLDKKEKPKLVPRFIGPFKILEVINSNAMRLELPRTMNRVHDVFNVDRLKHHKANPSKFRHRPIPKATPVILDDDGNELYIIEALLKQRQFNRKKEYLVKWHGQPEHEATWELEKDIKHVSHFKQLLQALRERKQATKPTTGGECSDPSG